MSGMGSAGEDTFIFNTLIPGGVSQEPEKCCGDLEGVNTSGWGDLRKTILLKR